MPEVKTEIVEPGNFGLLVMFKFRGHDVESKKRASRYYEKQYDKIESDINGDDDAVLQAYWHSWKAELNKTAERLTFLQKSRILLKANLTDTKERKFFFQHLEAMENEYFHEASHSKLSYTTFGGKLFNNVESNKELINKLNEFLITRNNIHEFIKACPRTFSSMLRQFDPQRDNNIFFSQLFLEEIRKNTTIANKKIYAKAYNTERLAEIFSLEEIATNPEYFLDILVFFQKNNPEVLKELFAEVAWAEANETQQVIRSGSTRREKGIRMLRQRFFSADSWAAVLTQDLKARAYAANEKCAKFLCQHFELSRILFCCSDKNQDQQAANLLLSSNAPKLLNLTRHKLHFAAVLAQKNIISNLVFTRIATSLIKTHSGNAFNKWWRSLKSISNNFASYAEKKLNEFAEGIKNSKYHQVNKEEQILINAWLTEDKIRGKLKIDAIVNSLGAFLDADLLTPLALKALASDNLFRKKFKQDYSHFSLEQQIVFIKKSPYFYVAFFGEFDLSNMLEIELTEIILDRKSSDEFWSYYPKETLEKHVAVDDKLINQILQRSTPKELRNCVEKFPHVLPRAILEKGYIEKLFQAYDTREKAEFYNRLVVDIAVINLSVEEKKFLIEYIKPRLPEDYIKSVINRYPDQTELWQSNQEKNQHWIWDKTGVPINLRFREKEFFIPFVKNLITSISPLKLEHTLLKVALFFANDVHYQDYLMPFLKYKFGIFSNNFKETILFYLQYKIFVPLQENRKASGNNNFDGVELFALQHDIERLLQCESLQTALGLTKKQIADLTGILEANRRPAPENIAFDPPVVSSDVVVLPETTKKKEREEIPIGKLEELTETTTQYSSIITLATTRGESSPKKGKTTPISNEKEAVISQRYYGY